MRITVEFGASQGLEVPDPENLSCQEFNGVGGFCTSFTDYSGEKSDGLPKYAAKTDTGVGLMMVEALEMLCRFGPMRIAVSASRCTILISKDEADQDPLMIQSDEGILLIDTMKPVPEAFFWRSHENSKSEAGSNIFDWLMAAYLSKIRGSLQTAHYKSCVRAALMEHMQSIQEQEAGVAAVAMATQNPAGVHLLGKGLPKRTRGRRGT